MPVIMVIPHHGIVGGDPLVVLGGVLLLTLGLLSVCA